MRLNRSPEYALLTIIYIALCKSKSKSKNKSKKTLFKVGTVKNNKTVTLVCNKC